MKYKSYRLPTVFSVERLVMVHYLELSKNTQYLPEAHDFWEFHYVDKGTAISISDGERIGLNHGEILFHRPMSEHQLIADGSVAPNVCVVSFHCSPKEIPFLYQKKLHLNAEARAIMKKFLAEAAEVFDLSHSDPAARSLSLRDEPSQTAAQLMRLYLEELLLLLQREHAVPRLKKSHVLLSVTYDDPLVNEMLAYMQENITGSLTISDFCRRFNYGKTHLSTRFTAATGKSISAYFTEMKIRAAKRIIREQNQGKECFSRIADLLGFGSASYFYSTFKRIVHMTPSEYFRSVHQYDAEKK